MRDTFVIKRKPFLYKFGAKIFKWLVLSNKTAECERIGTVIETYKTEFQGHKIAWEEMEHIDKKE